MLHLFFPHANVRVDALPAACPFKGSFKGAFKAGCRNWVIIGTSGEYGFVRNKPMSVKKTQLKPVNVYGKSKVLFYGSRKF